MSNKQSIRQLIAALLAAGCAAPAAAQEVPLTYTAAQAAAGKAAYESNCVACHGANLNDGPLGAPLRGAAFMRKYGGTTLDQLFTVTSTTMPTAAPGSLDRETYAALVAYMLERNEIAAGETPLPADARVLANVFVPASGFSFMAFSPYTAKPPAEISRLLERYSPVTDALLKNPPPGEWLIWRRTYDTHGFSPLRQVNADNVGELRVAWSWALPPGSNEAVPLVHDGVMFLFGFGDELQALDARTGDLLWHYTHQLEQGASPNNKRGIALYGDKVYMGTSDAHVIALDARTGKLAWDTEVADFRRRENVAAGPLAAAGLIMIGTTGTGVGAALGGPHVFGLDAETGEIEWTVNTIAQPGTPGGDSWNGIPGDRRSGASIWNSGSYDTETGLAYFGTGNTYDTGPLLAPSPGPGITNDALYTNTTLAIDPATGKLVWHFQHFPNDQWDLDWAFERQIIRLPVRGEMRTVTLTAGKIGIYEGVDAATGEYLFSMDLGLQNIVTAIDPETGDKTVDPKVMPGGGGVQLVCPHGAGAKNFLPAAYDSGNRKLVVPLAEACMDVFPVPGGEGGGGLSSGVNWGIRPIPGSDGNYGRLQAIDLEKREPRWTVRQRAPFTSGVLATAGDVIFAAALDRYLRAYDAGDGEVLWEARLADVSSSSPLTYSIDGKQYVAVVTGQGGFHAASFVPLLPEQRSPPDRGSAVWVFALP
jgi:alcohol dehydrogenase (cytochrome c)